MKTIIHEGYYFYEGYIAPRNEAESTVYVYACTKKFGWRWGCKAYLLEVIYHPDWTDQPPHIEVKGEPHNHPPDPSMMFPYPFQNLNEYKKSCV